MGSLKQIKSQVLAGFSGLIAKATRAGLTGFENPANPGYLGSGTQLTQLGSLE